ncbi:MAG: amidohydrolase family protein, partial [Deltaproteobacteria bacterium]|nr:amidohydrolase family protein [Deltaproteobacteria bacterium]
KFSGAYIGSNVNGRYYNSKDFDPFWKKAEDLDVLIVMHPEDVAGSERMGPYGLRLICGNPADSALSLGFLTYSGVFDRFPKLKLCVLHGGGFFPYHLGRFDRGFAVRYGARAAESSSPPSAYLKNLYFDNLVYRVETLDYLKRVVGAERALSASWWEPTIPTPWETGRRPRRSRRSTVRRRRKRPCSQEMPAGCSSSHRPAPSPHSSESSSGAEPSGRGSIDSPP